MSERIARSYILPVKIANIIDQAAMIYRMSKADVISEAILFRYRLEKELSNVSIEICKDLEESIPSIQICIRKVKDDSE